MNMQPLKPTFFIERNEQYGYGFQVRLESAFISRLVDDKPFSFNEAMHCAYQALSVYNEKYGTMWDNDDGCVRASIATMKEGSAADADCRRAYEMGKRGELKTESKNPLLRSEIVQDEDRIEKYESNGDVYCTFAPRGWLQVITFAFMDGAEKDLAKTLMLVLLRVAKLRGAEVSKEPEKILSSFEDNTIQYALDYMRRLYDEGYVTDKDIAKLLPEEWRWVEDVGTHTHEEN